MNETTPGITHGAATLAGWEVAWAQLVGTRHRITEDACAYRVPTPHERGRSAAALYLAVADGVGGGARGDIASQALVQHCLALPERLLSMAEDIAAWMRLAESEVQRALREVTFSPGAATLAAAWLKSDGSGCFLRVGDARLYRIGAGGQAIALTHDQTYAHVGEPPPSGASGEDPARMVGTGFMGEPELQTVRLRSGEALLLCSDGLHRGLEERDIAALLLAYATLEEAVIALALAARVAGSEDDISVLVARRCARGAARRDFWRWLMRRLRSAVAAPGIELVGRNGI